MGDGSWPYYLLLILLILGGGYFAGAEIAFASANKIRQKTQAEAGDPRAKTAMFIHDHFDSALTTLLIGNNIMHIGGSALATMLTSRIWGPKAAVWTTIVMTVLVFLSVKCCRRATPAATRIQPPWQSLAPCGF
jgi:Putative Mg2+ and Co2+ transporter CorB